MPPNLNYQEATSLPLVALTTWQALVDVAQLKPWAKTFDSRRVRRDWYVCHSIGKTYRGGSMDYNKR
jgi:NADPH:quinone reductase-like Zn-dependent oxidoreductase